MRFAKTPRIPLRWRFSLVGADHVSVGRSRGFDASCPTPVRAATAGGRSARKRRNRLGTEITHCRTGTGGIT
jgi:hypothetical protein